MGKTILVVEDNQDNRDIIVEFLSAYGFNVLQAADGTDGIEIFNAERPDLVLCDVLLPKVNGFGVCQEVKQDSDPVPVILMSALYKTHALQAEAKEKYGADDYLIKPLNLVELAGRISRMLGVTKEDLQKEAAEADEKDLEETGDATTQIPDSGSFEEFIPPLVVSNIHQSGKTGVLSCTGKSKKTIYFQVGVPLYAGSDNPEETYGALLVEDEKITAEEKKDYEKKAKAAKSTLSKYLLAKKLITAKEMADYMIREVNVRLVDLITWQSGEYRFVEGDEFLKKINRPLMAYPSLLYQGIKQADFIQFLYDRYGPLNGTIVNKVEDKLNLVADIDMDPEDLATFVLIDGERKVQDIFVESDQLPPDILKVFFTLELLGVISF